MEHDFVHFWNRLLLHSQVRRLRTPQPSLEPDLPPAGDNVDIGIFGGSNWRGEHSDLCHHVRSAAGPVEADDGDDRTGQVPRYLDFD